MIIRSLTPVDSTSPAPFVLALVASHVTAPKVLFDCHVAIRTSLRSDLLHPFVVVLYLVLLACQPFMPSYLALEAEGLFALRAFDLSCIFICGHGERRLALGVGAVLFVFHELDLEVFLELFILLEGLSIHKILNEFIFDRLAALMLKAFDPLA